MLTVKIHRSNDLDSTNLVRLHEGLPIEASIRNEFNSFKGRFVVDFEEGHERDVSFSLTPISGAFHLTVYEGTFNSNRMWKTDNNFIKIKTNDINYKRKTVYFVKVTPKWHLLDLFRDNTYTFTIVPILESSMSYLGAG